MMNAKPVTLAFANTFDSDAKRLPLPGEKPVLGVDPPAYDGDNTRYLMPDGTVWEYCGWSGYAVDNDHNGWFKVAQDET